MTKEGGFVRQQFIQAAVERVLGNERIILAEKIAHSTLFEPLPMQPPLAARIDQPIADEGLQDMPPAGPFGRVLGSGGILKPTGAHGNGAVIASLW